MDKVSRTLEELNPLEQLLDSTARGDREAFERLYKLSSGHLLAVALRILRRRDRAEDVLQEVYLTIWRKAGSFNPKAGRAMAWMATIARNHAIDRLRREQRSGDRLTEWNEQCEGDAALLLADASLPRDISMSVRSCVERLDERHRKAILLAYYYGLSHQELSARLDTPLGTVKTWVRRGLQQMKDCMEK